MANKEEIRRSGRNVNGRDRRCVEDTALDKSFSPRTWTHSDDDHRRANAEESVAHHPGTKRSRAQDR